MNKINKNKIIPKLRFPEFKDNGEWDNCQLEKIGTTISGLSGKTAKDFGDGEPFVTYKQVFDCSWINFKKCSNVIIGANENQNTLQKGDILITTSSETPNEVGFASVLLDNPTVKTYLNSFCFAFRPNSINKLKQEFSRYLFQSAIYRKSISTLAQGITRYNISKFSFLKLFLPIPTLPEQQKIADCLSSLDDLIESQIQKLENLKTHKKGLLQQLFPAEGEKVPKIRFPEFKNNGEWEEKKLGDLIKKNNRKNKDLSIELVQSVSNKFGFINQDKYFEDRIVASKDNSNYCIVDKGCFAYNPSRIDVGSLAYKNEDTISIISPLYVSFKTKEKIADLFLFNWFKTIEFYIQMKDSLTGGVRNSLNFDSLINIKISIPALPEQQKIADCLSSLDDLIESQIKKLENLKIHKKGLLQQLFPITN